MQCKRCVMDSSDPNITFNEQGTCNHCETALTKLQQLKQKDWFGLGQHYPVIRERKLHELIQTIKQDRQGKQYDSLIGLSGGADSSFLSLLAFRYGLKPLATQLDNGYGTPEANHNVEAIITKTGWTFQKLTVDPKDFDDLHLAYLKAGVIDIEVPSDHAIQAWNYRLAAKHGIHYILSGSNTATESIMPKAWTWNKGDLANLRDIHRKYGTHQLRSFPTMGPIKKAYMDLRYGIRQVFPLNLINYNREEAKKELATWCGWQDYGLKHFESIITRFYQGYILPTKFGVDKRRAHFSALICSGQMTREEALQRLENPIEYWDYPQFERDRKMVLQRLGLSDSEFEEIMKQPIRSHELFDSDGWLFSLMRKFRFMRKIL